MYDQGVQRSQLVSFLRALQVRSPVVEVSSPFDWRRLERSSPATAASTSDPAAAASAPESEAEKGRISWYTVRTPDEALVFQKALESTLGSLTGSPATLLVYGRPVSIPWASTSTDEEGRVARFSYEELCEKPLGPADYISLASNFETIVVEGVKAFSVLQKNEGPSPYARHLHTRDG